MLTRRTFVASTAAAGATAAAAVGAHAQDTVMTPLLERVRIATIGAPDLAAVERDYTAWLDQKVRERGTVDAATAASWGAPASAGRPYVLMSTDAHPDVYIRAVEIDAVPGYKALTTWGWNAIEIIIDDIDALYKELQNSPFRFIGQPASLGVRYPTIHAMQVVGPAQEVLYLTTEQGDRSKSSLPLPRGPVGRPFIMVMASGDVAASRAWWTETFAMKPQAINESLSGLARTAQNAPADAIYTISLVYLEQHGNMIQLDGYPAGTEPRPHADGQLPPGVAMTSFAVANLGAIKTEFVAPPAHLPGLAYGGHRAATAIGPGGTLVELIESA
ncbi:MAG: hypothetical protein KDE14_08420 [Rhodobacteraceae bacterium]|nr:hypothetical protein [Paracoccaceae bacterium]